MNALQAEKFEEYLCKHGADSNTILGFRREAWEACLAANGIEEASPIDDKKYRIGEGVEYMLDSSEGYKQAHIGLILPGDPEVAFNDVRRKPAWKPKDNEPVLFRSPSGRTCAGVYSYPNGVSGRVSHSTKVQDADNLEMRPYNPDLVDTPWDCEV